MKANVQMQYRRRQNVKTNLWVNMDKNMIMKDTPHMESSAVGRRETDTLNFTDQKTKKKKCTISKKPAVSQKMTFGTYETFNVAQNSKIHGLKTSN